MLSVPPLLDKTHPSLPKGQPILAFPKGRNWLLLLKISTNVHSPLSFSPVGEMQVSPVLSKTG